MFSDEEEQTRSCGALHGGALVSYFAMGLYSGMRAGAASAAALLLLLRLRPASAQADLCFFNAGNSTFNLRQFQANT